MQLYARMFWETSSCKLIDWHLCFPEGGVPLMPDAFAKRTDLEAD